MLIKEIMKRPFVIEKDMGLAEVAGIMSKKNIGSLLLVSGDEIKGIATEGDLIQNFGKHDRVSHIMETKVITINPDETLDRAVELMRENKIKRLPVVDDEKLVGIVTITDIIANIESLEEDFYFG